jgi:hypothetical protein
MLSGDEDHSNVRPDEDDAPISERFEVYGVHPFVLDALIVPAVGEPTHGGAVWIST